MRLDELTDDELLALLALAKLVVRADGQLSDSEAAKLEALARTLGPEKWASAVARAKERFKTRGDAMYFAETITRQQARERIYTALVELALPESIVEAEERALQWLAELWQIEQ